MSAEDPSGSDAAPGAAAAPPLLTLDESRETFYVAQRACERHAASLKAFVEVLDSKKAQADEAWIEAVQEEARKAFFFLSNQLAEMEAFAERADEYVESVRRLAERMAMAELKGETLDEAELPENKARTVHPELLRFKLEKRARILGKIGGVPAFGPGMAMPAMPTGGAALRATGSAAAREITYSKAEGRDARYMANVFQFKENTGRKPKEQEDEKAQWQQEASDMLRRKEIAEKAQEDLRKDLVSPFGAELSGVLQQRHNALKEKEEEAAAAASAERRSRAAAEKTDTTPELAAKLRRRQEEEAKAAREAAEEAKRAREAVEKGEDGEGGPTPAWHNPAAPFGNELAAALQRRNAAKAAAAAAAPAREARDEGSSGPPPGSELAQRLRKMQQHLQQQQGGGH